MRRIAITVVGVLAVAGIVGYVATMGGASDDELRAGATAGDVGAEPGLEMPVPEAVDDLGGLGEGFVAGDEVVGGGSVAELPGLPRIGSAVVRTAALSVEVGEGGFADAFDTASLVAGKYGGYVESSTTAGTDVRSGDLLIRVPADRFDEAMADLRALGTVERQELAGRDVTAEFVDLEARLRTWEAQEAVLLDLMSQAKTIEATLRVQRELQDVQLRIEEIEGQLRYLENRTDLATIQVSLHEPGAAAPPKRLSDRPSLVEAWDQAVDAFLAVCSAVVVGLGYLVPLSVLGLAVALAGRRLLRARPAAPPAG